TALPRHRAVAAASAGRSWLVGVADLGGCMVSRLASRSSGGGGGTVPLVSSHSRLARLSRSVRDRVGSPCAGSLQRRNAPQKPAAAAGDRRFGNDGDPGSLRIGAVSR